MSAPRAFKKAVIRSTRFLTRRPPRTSSQPIPPSTRTRPVVALDVMGGDYAPYEIIKGAIRAAREHNLGVQLVGPPDRISRELSNYDLKGLPLEIVPADDFITMEDKNPAASCRRRQGASIVVAMRQVAEGHADAVVSAGATGASSAAALFQLKRLPGIERPAIAARMPTSQGEMLLLDAGANVDSTPFQVAQHALMGSVFASQVMGFPQPRVGLLNIGEEPGKGSQSYRAAFDILDTLDGINFVGNVEGRTLAEQDCEVLVADGFVGNIFLKAVEGSVKMSFQMLHQEITRNFDTKMGALMCKPAFMRVRHERLNYAHYGGAVLLGVGGAVVIAHGISNDLAIKNAIKLAADTAKAQTLKHIQDSLAEDRMHGKNEG